MSKRLVAYFSTGGITAKLAKTLAASVGGDLYEIKAEAPYSEADLDWQNEKSRCCVEMADKSIRPAITGSVPDMSKYDVLYVGFPIWWDIAPTIINTFLEHCDLTGKTVIPFATSGESEMGDTYSELHGSCRGATLKTGKRFDENASAAELKEWASSVE